MIYLWEVRRRLGACEACSKMGKGLPVFAAAWSVAGRSVGAHDSDGRRDLWDQ